MARWEKVLDMAQLNAELKRGPGAAEHKLEAKMKAGDEAPLEEADRAAAAAEETAPPAGA